MEAKQCPDGSYVSRTGPKCEFSACPNPPPEPVPPLSPINKTCHGPGDAGCGLGYQCIQDCGPPVIRVDEPPPSYHCQTDAFAKKPRMCPICLASNTFVATPNGDVKVTDLKIGMPVWSLNAHGKKVPRTIIKVSQTPVSASHKVVHLILSDGREVWVSPNHPILNGHPIMSLHTGDIYDGAKIVSTDLVPYWDTATYDLLPDGDTDAYWANGILLESTLR
ncbi:MAG: hypothetical protein Q7N87_01500 [Candidatus Uhrbacteria bacterium]|nr:hypothetical protein [Candidatus Uhrbacteria bacterium]MDP3793532.1 hypothetical protein [Candidatus Uhrbacteria bacterium]